MSRPWRACSRAARSRSISWVKNTAPCPMVRPTSRPACSRTKLAVARCRSGGLKRLIWLPQGTGSEDDRQQAFIEALHHDAQAQFGADLIAGDIEELRAAIHATLRKIEQPEPKQPEPDASGRAARRWRAARS